MWIDSHCHLHYVDYDMAKDALDDGIKKIMCVATEISDFERLLQIKAKYPNLIDISLGQHPIDCDKFSDEILFEQLVKEYKDIIAIGETGFDHTGNLRLQRQVFDIHANIAMKWDLPIILHTRCVEEETMAALKNWPKLKGVFHCFTGSKKLADFAQEIGWMISFSGIVTFTKLDSLREIAKNVALENMLIETDAPYLAPKPMRGKENKASYVRYIGEFLSDLLGRDQESFAKTIEENYFRLFKKRVNKN